MQFNHFVSLLKESKPKFFRYWKVFSFLIPLAVLLEMTRRNASTLVWVSIDWDFLHCAVLAFVLLLMPLNWGLEAYKWHYLMKRFGFKVSFLSAFKTTLTGLAYSLVLPGGIGEFLGRAEAIPKGEAWRGAGVLSIARIAQLYATLLFGGISLSLYLWHRSYFYWFFFLLLTVLLCWFVFLFSSVIAQRLESKFGRYAFTNDLLAPWVRKGKEKTWVLVLSLFRYVVFTIQFYLVLVVFGVQGSAIDLLNGISSAFFLKSFFPSFLDLGPRELAVTLFFGDMGVSLSQVLAASLSIWFINIMFPALLGALLLLRNVVLNARVK